MHRAHPLRFLGQILLLGLLLSAGLWPQYTPALKRLQQAAAQGEPDRARQQALTALGRLPWRLDLWVQAGRYALEAGEAERAAAYYRRFQQLSRDTLAAGHLLSAEDWLNLGQAYLRNGDLAAARQAWQEGLRFQPDSAALYQQLLQLSLSQGDLEGAQQALQALIALEPDEAQYPYQLGLLLAAQEPSRALEYLRRAAQLDPALQPTYLAVQRSLLSSRRSEEPAYGLVEIGRTLARLGEWELAAQAFWQATRLRPDYAEAWAFLGEARQQLALRAAEREPPPAAPGPASDGLLELQTALALDPESLSAHAFLALYWARRGRPDLAVSALQVAAARDPHNPVWQIELGQQLARLGELERAFQHLTQAVQLSPYDPLPRLELVRFSLTYSYRIEEVALPAARQAILLSPGDAAGLTALGQVLLRLGDLANAERFFRSALQANPEFAAAHLGLGLLHLVRNELPLAWEELRTACRLDPGGAIAEQATRLAESYFPGMAFP